jgi:hypothetical protein
MEKIEFVKEQKNLSYICRLGEVKIGAQSASGFLKNFN